MEIQNIMNDYRSNLLVDLYKFSQTIENPMTLRYEDWILKANSEGILIYRNEELIYKYAKKETFLNQKINYKNKMPLSSIIKLGTIL